MVARQTIDTPSNHAKEILAYRRRRDCNFSNLCSVDDCAISLINDSRCAFILHFALRCDSIRAPHVNPKLTVLLEAGAGIARGPILPTTETTRAATRVRHAEPVSRD